MKSLEWVSKLTPLFLPRVTSPHQNPKPSLFHHAPALPRLQKQGEHLLSSMATPAARTMLSKNGSLSILQVLRGRKLRGSSTIKVGTQFVSCPMLQVTSPNMPQFLLGDLSNAGVAHAAIDASNVNDTLNWRFGGFGEMGRVEARGKKVAIEDRDEAEDYEDDDDLDGEELEDLVDEFEDEVHDGEDGSDFEDDDVADVRRK